ncbi:hypothetical protein GCM10007036_43780 [Alsobacter metallidurans]|uniref:Uncharacterized protein n=2 Tax=Alsobacter metallidurans TaxID=340221 RepID=A0A917IBI0_9HYPH|nr:hypothetical protein GCM10007036_43780 [Alsobacter metallidurans]
MSITIQGQGRTSAPGPLSAGGGSAEFAEALRARREAAAQPSGREAIQQRPRDPQTSIIGLISTPANPPREKLVSCGAHRPGERLPGALVRIVAEPPTPRLIGGPCADVAPIIGRY